MSNLAEKSIGDLCTEYYIEYGRELNSNRALPLLYDGLKPVYRRALFTILNAPGNHVKSAEFVGNMLKIHPHGDKSIVDVETKLVRAGVFKELGNFGYYPIYGPIKNAAKPRYTETGIEDNWFDIINPMIKEVPYIEGEVQGVIEPQYIPTCIPLSLVFGSQGIGMGINTNIPSFSPKSILAAYLNDDPSLLEPYYDLEIDHELSELDRLWNTGTGRVIYKFHVELGTDLEGREGVYVSGDTQIFTPTWFQIDLWKGQGLIFTRDETTEGKYRVFIGRNKGVRKVTQEMIYEECKKCCSTSFAFQDIQTIYRLGIHDGTIARYIPMRDWIDITYKNYVNLVNQYKKNNISKLEFDIQVYTYLKDVAEILLNTKEDITNEDIARTLNISIDIVNAITRKSISTLKRVDTEAMIASFNNRIEEFNSIIPEVFIEDIINKM